MLIVGMGNAAVTPTLVEELSVAAVGVDVESSIGSGALTTAAAGARVSVVDVEVDG